MTYALEVRCSIQLSYRGKGKDYLNNVTCPCMLTTLVDL